MAKLSELQQAYANPNVRKYLDFIASSEGVKHGYNTMFGNERFNSLGAHPNVRKEFKQTDGTINHTTAAGRYQFLNGTWGGLAKQYGFRDFSPQNQDMGAIALIAQRGALKDVMNGNWNGANGKLGKEWASLPSSRYKQGKRSQEFVDKFFGSVGRQLPSSQPNYLSDEQVAKLFPSRGKQPPQPQYLSDSEVAALFPNQNKQSNQPQYLPDDQVEKLFPNSQLNQSAQPNYLSDEQVAQLFPKV